jgi:RNA polymerase sigma factor (sigma-70 family)
MRMGQRSGIVSGQIQRLFSRGTVSGLSEGQLLARFVGERDEVAFEAIVSRHGPMVLGICRRLLEDPHDVEDAFQATFLVLVRKARELRDRDLLANWLYGVALRVATRSRRDRSLRRIRERTDIEKDEVIPPDDLDRRELDSVIDAEVARLPVRFRTPIVLCYFEGLTHDQAAERMNCPVGTVRSRMSKGRELLRSRLSRRGLAPTPALLAIGPIAGIAPSVPPALIFKTIAAATSVAAGRSMVAGIVSTSAIALTQGVLRTMSISRWTTLAAAFMVLGTLGGGIGVAARQQGPEPVKEVKSPPTQSPTESARKVSRSGEVTAAVVGPESPANPARKALKTAEEELAKYEKQLNMSQAEILRLNAEIALLKTRIKALESPDNRASIRSVQPAAGVGPKRPDPGEGPGVEANDVSSPDFITSSPGVIVSQSARNDRVVILATSTGTARSYRPPQGMKALNVTIWQPYVLIASNGPATAQLAAYDLKHDKWTTADLGGRSQDLIALISIIPPQPGNTLVAPSFQGSSLTQLAVFDSTHFRWSVQDLVEPSDKKSAQPYFKGNVAIYVLGRKIYAYSTQAGRWDVLTLEKPFGNGMMAGQQPLVDHDSAAVSQDGRLHVFTAKLGRWQTIDPKD